MKEVNVMLQTSQGLNIDEQLLALMDLLMQCMIHRNESDDATCLAQKVGLNNIKCSGEDDKQILTASSSVMTLMTRQLQIWMTPHLDEFGNGSNSPSGELRKKDHALNSTELKKRNIGTHLCNALHLDHHHIVCLRILGLIHPTIRMRCHRLALYLNVALSNFIAEFVSGGLCLPKKPFGREFLLMRFVGQRFCFVIPKFEIPPQIQ